MGALYHNTFGINHLASPTRPLSSGKTTEMRTNPHTSQFRPTSATILRYPLLQASETRPARASGAQAKARGRLRENAIWAASL